MHVVIAAMRSSTCARVPPRPSQNPVIPHTPYTLPHAAGGEKVKVDHADAMKASGE
jgi:hypothetical protein